MVVPEAMAASLFDSFLRTRHDRRIHPLGATRMVLLGKTFRQNRSNTIRGKTGGRPGPAKLSLSVAKQLPILQDDRVAITPEGVIA
jgi:hypothetical protein